MLQANVVVMIVGLLTGVLTARVLGPAGKGVYNAVTVWAGVGSALVGAGIPSAFVVLFRQSDSALRPRILGASLLLYAAWSLTVTLCLLLVVRVVLRHLGPTVQTLAELALFAVPLAGLAQVMEAVQVTVSAYRFLNLLNVLSTLGLAVPVVCLWALGRLTPVSLVVASLSSTVAGNLLIVISTIHLLRSSKLATALPDVRAFESVTRLSATFYTVGLASMFNASLDQMLTTTWLTARQVGLYAVASTSLMVTGLMARPFHRVFLPAVAADDQESIRERTEAGFRRGAWALAIMAVIVAVGSWPVLALFYGQRYLDAFPIVLMLLPAGVCAGLVSVVYQGSYALRDPVTPLVGEFVGAASGAALLAVFVPRFGMAGAAVATSASYCLDLASVVVFWGRRQGGANLLPRGADLVENVQAGLRLTRAAIGTRIHRTNSE